MGGGWVLGGLSLDAFVWCVQNVCKQGLGHGERIRQGLRRAARQGAVLGGLRPAAKEHNTAAHAEALRQAMDWRDVLEAGHDKSLSALSRDLFEAGCCTRSDKPLTPEMVRRLRIRLEEAKQAIEAGELEDEWAEWLPFEALKTALIQENDLAFRWLLKMARKEYGDPFADGLLQRLLEFDHAEWVRTSLGEVRRSNLSQAQHPPSVD